jgi:hypothetical protein
MAGAALREVFAIFGVQVDPEGNIDKGHKKVSGLKTAFEGAVAAFAGGALIGATRAFATQLEGLQDLSLQTGLTTDRVQQLGFMAEQNGSSAEEMGNSLLIMTRAMRAGTSAAGPQADAMRTLGISMLNAANQPKSLAEALPEVFENFGKLKNSAEEAQVATALFGRGGVKMLPTLRQGAAGLEAYSAQLAELGGPVAADTIAKADEMNDSFLKMDRALFALKGTVGAEVFPQITKLITGVGKGIAKLSDFAKGTTLAQSGSLALGIAIAGPLMSALGPLLKPGLKFAAIFLAMDDAIAFLQGKDSVIGAILNGFFGPDTTEGVRAWTNGVVEDFGVIFKSGTGIFHALNMAWGSMLNDMFIAVSGWVLDVQNAWNSLAPEALQIDTGDAVKRLDEYKRIRDGYRAEAFDATNPEQAKRREAELAQLDADSRGTGRRDRKLTGSEIRGVFGRPPPPAPSGGPAASVFNPAFGNGRREPSKAAGFAADFAPGTGRRTGATGAVATAAAPFFAPLPAAPVQKVENHIDARTTVQAVTNADPKEIASAVATKQKEALRNAYTSTTARSGAAAAFFK